MSVYSKYGNARVQGGRETRTVTITWTIWNGFFCKSRVFVHTQTHTHAHTHTGSVLCCREWNGVSGV